MDVIIQDLDHLVGAYMDLILDPNVPDCMCMESDPDQILRDKKKNAFYIRFTKNEKL